MWQGLPTEDEVHVLPVNDVIAHELSDECACMPFIDPVVRDNGGSYGWVVVHNAWDGREE